MLASVNLLKYSVKSIKKGNTTKIVIPFLRNFSNSVTDRDKLSKAYSSNCALTF